MNHNLNGIRHNVHTIHKHDSDKAFIFSFLSPSFVVVNFSVFSSSRFPSAQVSSIYADASIGNSIKIAVVHIMYIEHELVPDASSGNGKYEKDSSPTVASSARVAKAAQ